VARRQIGSPTLANAPAPYGGRSQPAGDPAAGAAWGEAWSQPTSVRSTAAAHVEESPPRRSARGTESPTVLAPARPSAPERGLPGWAALLVLLAVAGIGGVIDAISGAQVRGGFNYGIIVASFLAILLVKRSAMFPIVVAPPLVYAAASAAMLYVRSSGLNDRKVLFDAATNWLVYGFPAMAGASAAVLIIAGIRLIVRR
jgi:hypothetical protein